MLFHTGTGDQIVCVNLMIEDEVSHQIRMRMQVFCRINKLINLFEIRAESGIGLCRFDGIPIKQIAEMGHISAGHIRLRQNGELRQNSDMSDMISSIAQIISDLSHVQELAPGDLIFTGTPSGVGPVSPGDRIEVNIKDLPTLSVTITGPSS